MAVWLRVAREVATLSHCTRRQFGALVLDPEENTPLAIGYNGAARGGGRLCGGEHCIREGILSGERTEIGCHHAEANALMHLARIGTSTRGRWIVVTGEPCLACAKLIHHAGIARVCVVARGYAGANGVGYLRAHGVEVVEYPGEEDPRG